MTPDEIRPHSQPAPASSGSELREKAQNIARDVREVGHAAREVAREKAHEARLAGEDYLEKGRDKAREYEDHVVEYVRANPIKSVLIALAAGVVLGSLTRH